MLENPLREFVEQLYQAPNVADTAIDLQDRYGLDVNVLLTMTWCGVSGYKVSNTDLTELGGVLLESTATIQSIRKARRDEGAKDKLSELYSQLKLSELAAEYQHLALCYQYFSKKLDGAGSVDLMLFNNQQYLSCFLLDKSDVERWFDLILSNIK